MSKKATIAIKDKPSKMGRHPIDVDQLRVQIFYHAPKALNDIELCAFLDISHDTFYKLKKNNTDFSEAIKHYKRISPIEVLQSFKKIAVGFEYDEKTSELKKDAKTGKYKLVVTKSVRKYFTPNAQAGFNYLKNQMQEEFKDKVETEHTFPGMLENITFVIEGRNKGV